MIKCISYPKLKEDFYNNIEPTHNKSINMKKIIAFSLWGNNECYNWGAVENALLAIMYSIVLIGNAKNLGTDSDITDAVVRFL